MRGQTRPFSLQPRPDPCKCLGHTRVTMWWSLALEAATFPPASPPRLAHGAARQAAAAVRNGWSGTNGALARNTVAVGPCRPCAQVARLDLSDNRLTAAAAETLGSAAKKARSPRYCAAWDTRNDCAGRARSAMGYPLHHVAWDTRWTMSHGIRAMTVPDGLAAQWDTRCTMSHGIPAAPCRMGYAQ